MSDTLRIVLFIALICYFCILFYFLKKQILTLKYSLLWLLIGIILSVLVIFPDFLTYIAHFLGIELPVNGLFTVAIGLILMLLMSLTVIVSGQSRKLRILTQQAAILERQIRELQYAEDYVKEKEV